MGVLEWTESVKNKTSLVGDGVGSADGRVDFLMGGMRFCPAGGDGVSLRNVSETRGESTVGSDGTPCSQKSCD